MTLDGFFNVTEMSNGLTAPSRVRELVALMQKGDDSIVKSFDDSSKQWSAVANALAATESKDCLDLFIELDGLHFLDKWLRDAHKFNNEPSDTLAEDSISHLLGALGKLHVDSEKLVASGIWNTVKDLTAHNNSGVQEKAREIFENWEKKTEVNAPISDVEKLEGSIDVIERVNGGTENCVEDSSIPKETSIQEKIQASTSDCPVLATSSDAANDAQVEIAHIVEKKLEETLIDDRPLDHVNSPSLANTLADTAMDMVDSSGELKATLPIASPQEKVVSLEESKSSEDFTSRTDATNALKSVTEEHSEKISSNAGISSWAFGSSFAKETDSKAAYNAEKKDDFMNHIFKKSPSREKSLKNVKDSGTSLSDMEVGAKINKLNLRKSESHLVSSYTGRTGNADKVSDAALDYGILDPLELARQVAMEVEKEVGDYGEQSCSSSDKLPEGRKPDSPDSITEKKSHASQGSDIEVANDPDSSGEASKKLEDSATSTEKEDTNGKLDMETDTPQVVEETQKEAKVEKVFSGFDLNQISSEDADDHFENQFTAPVSVVSASRAAANPGQPSGPLQFEGNLGWKGSAATSAFRPALNRRVFETEKDFSACESSSSSKRRQVCLDFDLNMTDSVDDTHVLQYSGIPSGESSMETNSRKPERVELDLNHTSVDNTGPYVWKKEQSPFPFGNGHHHNLSHSSSPSSKHIFQTSNFDLNGQPSFPSESSDNSNLSKYHYQNPHISGGGKSEEASISLLGTRLYVKRKDPVSQPPPLQYGRTPELAFDLSFGKSGNHLGVGSVLPYSHSPQVYGYNNIGPGPSPMPLPTMSFPSTMYGSTGPIPYMMDSRGAPIIPQLAGPGFPSTAAFSQQPQFHMNMTNSNPANGFGSSRNTLDLSTGMMMMESGNGEPVGFRQFLNVGQGRSVDEQMRQNAQQAMNMFGGKRKEPENGFPYTQYMPPWQ